MQAGRRFAAHLANARNRLRPLASKPGTMRALRKTATAAGPTRDQMQLTDQREMTPL